ncbi:MAG: Fe-S protein assembly co-chaperone HscB [Phycisphaeraceae bacterium]|nr:Fe-S protein assembly co-chaperone HscB [Phycisphaeraceae bacterium]
MDDPFTLLGLPPRFDLDEADLHARYLSAAARNHPDRFTDPLEQAEAADRAALLNDAYRTLSDPEQRANALLRVLGGSAKEDDNTLPPDLLMDMMDVRERMEDAIASSDTTALSELRTWADQQRKSHLERIAALFAASPPDLKQVRIELNALRYFERMIEQMPE